MDFSNNGEEGKRKSLTGIIAVVGFHVLAGYIVVSGTGKHLIEKIKNPIETKIIEEVKPPPKDLPPPPPPPDIKTPPPPFIPPPEVVVAQQQPQANTITQTTAVAPTTTALPKAPIVQAPVEVAAKPAPIPRTAATVNVNDCPKLEYPKASHRNEEEGTVIIEFLIGADGRVKNSSIVKSSGHRELDKAAVTGLTSCNKFKAGTVDGKPVESSSKVAYEWKIE